MDVLDGAFAAVIAAAATAEQQQQQSMAQFNAATYKETIISRNYL